MKPDNPVCPGDQVWHHESNTSVAVVAVDDEARELCHLIDGAERWVPLTAVTVQRGATEQEARRALIDSARTSGRRGVVARRALALHWSASR